MARRVIALAVLLVAAAVAHQPVQLAHPAIRKLEANGLCAALIAIYRGNEYATVDASDLLVVASDLSGYAGKAMDKAEANKQELRKDISRVEGKIPDSAAIVRQFRRYADARLATVAAVDSVSGAVAALEDSLAGYVRSALDSAEVTAIIRRQTGELAASVLDSVRARLNDVEAELERLRETPGNGGSSVPSKAPVRLGFYLEQSAGDFYFGAVDSTLMPDRVYAIYRQLVENQLPGVQLVPILPRECSGGMFVGARVIHPENIGDAGREGVRTIDFGGRAGTAKPEGSDR